MKARCRNFQGAFDNYAGLATGLSAEGKGQDAPIGAGAATGTRGD